MHRGVSAWKYMMLFFVVMVILVVCLIFTEEINADRYYLAVMVVFFVRYLNLSKI